MDHELRADEFGLAVLEFTPTEFEVTWSLVAVDDAGRTGRRRVTLRCGGAADDYLVRTDRAVYRGGETMRVTVLGGGVEPVFLDLLKDGQTILSTTIALKDGQGEQTIDLPAELAGTVLLCAYRYGTAGLPVAKTRAIHVRQARALAIETAFDRAEYRPGARAKLELTLRDDERPARCRGPSACRPSMRPSSRVVAQRPGLEKTFFEPRTGDPEAGIRDSGLVARRIRSEPAAGL